MIAYFSFQPGLGGHFFQRLLFWRWGLVSKPKANSYWNEYHFPQEYWRLPEMSRLQINLDYGEEWIDSKNYDPTVLEEYLKTFEIPTTNSFILDHQIFPNLNKSMKKIKGIECPNIVLTTRNIKTALFCRHLRDIKSLMKDHYDLRDDKNMNIREKEIWYSTGPSPLELGAKELLPIPHTERLKIRSIMDLEVEHADIIFDYDSLIEGDISCFEEVDNYYQLTPVIPNEDIINSIRWYNVENKKLIKDLE